MQGKKILPREDEDAAGFPRAMAAQVETIQQQDSGGGDVTTITAGDPSQARNDDDVANYAQDSVEEIEKTRTLICALNFLSQNLPLPQDVFEAVSSIYKTDDGAAAAAANAATEEDEKDDVARREANNQGDDSEVVGGGGVGFGSETMKCF